MTFPTHRERQLQYVRDGGLVKASAAPAGAKLIKNLLAKGWIEQRGLGMNYFIGSRTTASRQCPSHSHRRSAPKISVRQNRRRQRQLVPVCSSGTDLPCPNATYVVGPKREGQMKNGGPRQSQICGRCRINRRITNRSCCPGASRYLNRDF